jgi:hypothetical protein
MCEKCKGLLSCNVHMCPRASVGIPAGSPRPLASLRLPTDAPPQRLRSSSRFRTTFTLLDTAGKL